MQAMPNENSSQERIPVSFFWSGETRSQRFRGLSIKVVDLEIKGAATRISVHLPREDLKEGESRKLPFTCRKHQGLLPVETHPDLLSLRLEQVRNMTLKVGFFEPGRPIGPMILHPNGRRTQQATLKRSDREIKLELPDQLEPGGEWRLVVESNSLEPIARLERADRPL